MFMKKFMNFRVKDYAKKNRKKIHKRQQNYNQFKSVIGYIKDSIVNFFT